MSSMRLVMPPRVEVDPQQILALCIDFRAPNAASSKCHGLTELQFVHMAVLTSNSASWRSNSKWWPNMHTHQGIIHLSCSLCTEMRKFMDTHTPYILMVDLPYLSRINMKVRLPSDTRVNLVSMPLQRLRIPPTRTTSTPTRERTGNKPQS